MALLSTEKAILFHRYNGLDWIVLVLLFVITTIIYAATEPFCRPFQWTDASIGYPVLPDTFPNYSLTLMIIIGLVIIVLTVLFGARLLRGSLPEPLSACGLVPVEEAEDDGGGGRYKDREDNQENPAGPLYPWIRMYVWAVLLQFMTTQLMKKYAGRLRPDFLDRLAAAGYTAATKDAPSPMKDPQFYCQLSAAHPELREGRLSFPSGHSSTSTVCCFSLVLFLFAYLRPFARQGSFTRLCVSLSPLIVSVLCCISRTRDNKHNFSDILAGALIGFVTPLISFHLCFRQVGGGASIYTARSGTDVEAALCQRAMRPLGSASQAASYHTEENTVAVTVNGEGEQPPSSNSVYSVEKRLNQDANTVPWI